MKTIIAAVDLSKVSKKVVKQACRLASANKGKVVLVHVEQPPPIIMNDYDAADSVMVAELTASGREIAKRKLTELERQCRRAKTKVSTVSLRGQPRDEILSQSRKLRAEYIVLGSHGHTAAYDLLIGSVAQGVLRKARCPVVIVPAAPAAT